MPPEQTGPHQGRLVIWGAGGHAKVVADIARLCGYADIVAFIDDVDPNRAGQRFCGSTVRDATCLAGLREAGGAAAIVAIGACRPRLEKARQLARHGFPLVTLVHPRAVVAADVSLGAGTVVAAGAVLNPGAAIGAAAIINTAAVVDHDCDIGDGSHIGPGAKLAGHVRTGAEVWVGIGATVIDKVSIGDGAIIGAGAVVLHDVPPRQNAYGLPARIIREVPQ